MTTSIAIDNPPHLREVVGYLVQRIVLMGMRIIDWPDYVVELDTSTSMIVLDMAAGNMTIWHNKINSVIGSIKEKYVACHIIINSHDVSRVNITLCFCRASSAYIVLDRGEKKTTNKL